MGRYRSRSRSRSYSPVRRKHYDDPRDHRRRQRRSSPSAPSGLLVRNISLSARPEDLRIPFERFGPLKDVYLPKDYYTGEPRGFGFVKFKFSEDAAEAKAQLNHTVIGGREIRIVFAEENRKTPQQMRRLTRLSNRGSYRRRSLSRSPRRRYQSYSRSPSPARHDSRDGGARDAYYSSHRSRSLSRSVSPREERRYRSTREERSYRSPGEERSYRSPREGRSYQSPKEERNYRSNDRSPGRSRSISRSLSPHNEKVGRQRHQRPSPGENGQRADDEDYARVHDEGYKPSRSDTR